MTTTLKLFRVDDGGESVWAITDDPEKARAISRQYLRDSEHPEDCDDEETIRELDPSEMLSIRDDEDGTLQKQTVAEWIEAEGEGFLCTTCC